MGRDANAISGHGHGARPSGAAHIGNDRGALPVDCHPGAVAPGRNDQRMGHAQECGWRMCNNRGVPIELSLRVAPPQAASQVYHALAGPGGLGFISAATHDDGKIELTCDESRFSARLLRATIDASLLSSPGAHATITLHEPLSDEMLARIAAEGLQAPELTADRMIEVQLAKAGFDD
ncbi:MAG: hypothetical protein ACYDA1_03605 [Vulcanimicrobiaceae bacterium]